MSSGEEWEPGGGGGTQPHGAEASPSVPVNSSGRTMRQSAARASAKLLSWTKDEGLALTKLTGRDIFVTAKLRADNARQRGGSRGSDSVALGRSKRQRHARAVDPDMLDTEEALGGSEQERAAWPPQADRASPLMQQQEQQGGQQQGLNGDAAGAAADAAQAGAVAGASSTAAEAVDIPPASQAAAPAAAVQAADAVPGQVAPQPASKIQSPARSMPVLQHAPAPAQEQLQQGLQHRSGTGTPRSRSRSQQPGAEVSRQPAPASAAAAAGLASAGGTHDLLFGCPKCRYLRNGCGSCRAKPPVFSRPRLRWQPAAGHHQAGVPSAPVFRPTAAEFKDPVAYITQIMPEASKYGLAHIVPPEGFDPPFALEKGTNGVSMESFRFSVRKQLTSHLCCRAAPARPAGPAAAAATGGNASGRYGRQPSAAASPGDNGKSSASRKAGQRMSSQGLAGAGAAQQQQQQGEAVGGQPRMGPAHSEAAGEFGFVTLDKKHTLRSFAAYADWVKAMHFSEPPPGPTPKPATVTAAQLQLPDAAGSEPDRLQQPAGSARRPRQLPDASQTFGEPTVEEVEAEFWRIVESPDSVLESLYGQDLDSGHHGSGFPLPEWRRRLLQQHLGGAELPPYADEAERRWAEHPWNINNMPRRSSSVLRYLTANELITGVMVPWVYVGSALSAFCWHVEDHALYSVNFLHMGAPKVWYGVPASATQALEEALRDALPHLVEASPNLLYQLVTMLSPLELMRRGVPVYRVVHEPGTFVVTMPNAYHSGFNCGFNVAEAVNFGAPNWLPFGSDVAEKYRRSHKPLTFSHDSLLVALVNAAQHLPQRVLDAAAAAGAEGSPAAAAAGTLEPEACEEQQPPALGGMPWAHAPLQGVQLACGELALRAAEERSRRVAGEAAVGRPLPVLRMDAAAAPAARDSASGVHINTADVDCAECATDLWLSAVVSASAPGVAVCPEHAAVLPQKHGCAPESLVLLERHSPEELDAMVAAAVARVPGAAAAVEAAASRRQRQEQERVSARSCGPLYVLVEPGKPAAALAMPAEVLGESDSEWEGDGEDASDADFAPKRGKKSSGRNKAQKQPRAQASRANSSGSASKRKQQDGQQGHPQRSPSSGAKRPRKQKTQPLAAEQTGSQPQQQQQQQAGSQAQAQAVDEGTLGPAAIPDEPTALYHPASPQAPKAASPRALAQQAQQVQQAGPVLLPDEEAYIVWNPPEEPEEKAAVPAAEPAAQPAEAQAPAAVPCAEAAEGAEQQAAGLAARISSSAELGPEAPAGQAALLAAAVPAGEALPDASPPRAEQQLQEQPDSFAVAAPAAAALPQSTAHQQHLAALMPEAVAAAVAVRAAAAVSSGLAPPAASVDHPAFMAQQMAELSAQLTATGSAATDAVDVAAGSQGGREEPQGWAPAEQEYQLQLIGPPGDAALNGAPTC